MNLELQRKKKPLNLINGSTIDYDADDEFYKHCSIKSLSFVTRKTI